MISLRLRISPFNLALGLAFVGFGLEALGILTWLALGNHPFSCLVLCRLQCAFLGDDQGSLMGLGLFLGMTTGILLFGTLLRASWRSLGTFIRTKKALQALRAQPGGPEWPGNWLRIFEDDSCPMAFTAGFLNPKVYASQTLMRTASPEELRLVLAHELHHVTRKDPLRVWILSFLALSFPGCPLFAWLKARFLEEAEIQADDAALQAVNDPGLLAKTLLRFSAQGSRMIAAFFGQGSQNAVLFKRVMRLAGHPMADSGSPPSLPVLWPSFLFYGILLMGPALALAWHFRQGAGILECLCRIGLP